MGLALPSWGVSRDGGGAGRGVLGRAQDWRKALGRAEMHRVVPGLGRERWGGGGQDAAPALRELRGTITHHRPPSPPIAAETGRNSAHAPAVGGAGRKARPRPSPRAGPRPLRPPLAGHWLGGFPALARRRHGGRRGGGAGAGAAPRRRRAPAALPGQRGRGHRGWGGWGVPGGRPALTLPGVAGGGAAAGAGGDAGAVRAQPGRRVSVEPPPVPPHRRPAPL